MGSEAEPISATQGFSQKVLRYFQNFLQTDFKKRQAPRRRIQMKSDVGFLMGIPLRKYPSLYNAAWKFVEEAPESGLTMKIPRGKFTSRISPTLRDLIRQHLGTIKEDDITHIAAAVVNYAVTNRARGNEDPERFVESVQVQFVEETASRIVQPFLALLEASFQQAAYSAIDSVYDIEADLTESLTYSVIEQMPTAVNTITVSGDDAPLKAVFEEFFQTEDIRDKANQFLDDFATSDAFQEMRDLQHSFRSAENQSLYLYLCEIRFGPHAFPLFYIPVSFDFNEGERAFILEFDPHLLVNKQAIDWIVQEHKAESTKLPISPVTDRVLYLDGQSCFLDEMESVFSRLIPTFEIASEIDLRKGMLQQASSPTIKISTSAWFAVFDKSDESLLNDYEELLAAFSEDQKGAGQLFDQIIQGFLFDNPFSVGASVDTAWDELSIPDRLVADSPIPLNEEQRKILEALKNPNCNYVSVQGPPGTGKSHTITALAFDGILSGKSVLVLSDKAEALDVAQDKLESVLSKVRHGDHDFPNPILRLGKSGNTYNRLVSASAREKIKMHHQAAMRHADEMSQQMDNTINSLRSDISKSVDTLSQIQLGDIEHLQRLEAEIDNECPGLSRKLQDPLVPERMEIIRQAVSQLDSDAIPSILSVLSHENEGTTLHAIIPKLNAWKRASALSQSIDSPAPLSLFLYLEEEHQNVLLRAISEYESLRMPIFGWFFRTGQVVALNMRVASELPCPNPASLHRHLNDLKEASGILGAIKTDLTREGLGQLTGFVWHILREGIADQTNVEDLSNLLSTFSFQFWESPNAMEDGLRTIKSQNLEYVIAFIAKASQYAILWHDIESKMDDLPRTDYVGTKAKIEQLNTARMTIAIDQRFLDFVENKKATVKEIGGVIKGKQKFPENEFHHLSEAFPVIIAGIRDYAEYVPLKQQLFDLVVIDEASQVSVAQALPAVLRAKKVVVFGDAKQFSNVKSAQASNTTNASYLVDVEAYFRKHISDVATKVERLKYFDVKRSILEFFDLIANYQTMLRKHFRGYQELISFSSKWFYDKQLQAIKIRSKPIREVIRFEELEATDEDSAKNTNRSEADFILQELRKLIDESAEASVGVITPFREQVKLLNEVLYRDSYGERFDSDLRLKVMTFDTCQGEERDLIIYSMVATPDRDALNYIFPTNLENIADKVEETIKAQRLNVGFSRAKEGILFVLSKPVDQFRGSIRQVLIHYKAILEDRSRPDESQTDPSSPMERKVLDWLYKTSFMQHHEDNVEVVPQFPIGEYLKQLDPFYSHPAYRCDFLLRYDNDKDTINVIIEYDGFAEHFIERDRIHEGNWDRYYRPEDVERQMVIESYGYKFLRINRFNLGGDPVATLSERLYELIDVVSDNGKDTAPVERIKKDAESLEDGTKKRCTRCNEIRDIEDFWDSNLKNGIGNYGRVCMQCKNSDNQSYGFRRRRYRRF